ncbi:MAG: outer membrane protein OmpA-like peptidoglycan-associated protein [Halioglobus sp.]|jgi:outer membrane protein OmpA-like peptidoglycan-associated protein
MTTIQRAIGAIRGRKEGVAIIAGYSDPLGSTAYNLALSRKRAQAVVDFLLALGVSSDRLRLEGRGAYAPLGLKASEELPELSRIAQIITEKSGEW